MSNKEAEKLLSDKRVVEEIHRHLWIESEKAGYDIGFDKAREDWLKNFSKAWMRYHMPDAPRTAKPASPKPAAGRRSNPAKSKPIRRRRAKSYIKS